MLPRSPAWYHMTPAPSAPPGQYLPTHMSYPHPLFNTTLCMPCEATDPISPIFRSSLPLLRRPGRETCPPASQLFFPHRTTPCRGHVRLPPVCVVLAHAGSSSATIPVSRKWPCVPWLVPPHPARSVLCPHGTTPCRRHVRLPPACLLTSLPHPCPETLSVPGSCFPGPLPGTT